MEDFNALIQELVETVHYQNPDGTDFHETIVIEDTEDDE